MSGYQELRDLTYGHLAEILLRVPASERAVLGRFLARVEVDENGCWIFSGETTHNGYGRFFHAGRHEMAHRFAYRMLRGPIPEGLTLDHLCRVRPCVNPAHLEPVTNAENARRGATANRTHCPSGHAYDEANTRVYQGRRYCRACNTGGGEGRTTIGARGGVPLSSNALRKVMRAKELVGA